MNSKQHYFTSLGMAADLMSRSAPYQGYAVACLNEWIKPAILLNQILFFRNLGGVAVGYATWALLSEDVERRLINDPCVLLHLSEWNEGDRLWIMDMVVINGDVRHFIGQIYDAFASSYSRVKYLRRGSDGAVRKVFTWNRRDC